MIKDLRHDFQNGGHLESAILDILLFSEQLKTTEIGRKVIKTNK